MSATPAPRFPLSMKLKLALPFVLSFAASAAAQTLPAPQATPEEINEQWVQAMQSYAPVRQGELTLLEKTIAGGPYQADWQSLEKHTTPAWFQDAKFGIFLHWGLFSVPAYGNEWYSRNMYQAGSPEFAHQVATYGPQSKFGYKDFIPMFRMEKFDPNAWADLFKRAGARYVVPVAEHHDGFALFKTSLTPWNAVEMGPHRDLIGDLQSAVLSHGLKFGVSYHRAEHDWFFDGGRSFDSDVNDPKYAGFYGPAEHRDNYSTDDSLAKDYTFVSEQFRSDWLARTVELQSRYHPDLVYYDWWVGYPDFRECGEKSAAFYYDQAAQRQQQVVMFSKYDNLAPGAGTHDVERGALPEIEKLPWQTDTSISNASWGYVEHDTFKTPQTILDQLIDVVSKNGNLLLNIGPRPDGTIPDEAAKTLLAIGSWLDTNGEAIYGSRPWRTFAEGPTRIKSGTFQDLAATKYKAEDFRFTTHNGLLYAIEMRWPTNGEALVHSLATGLPGDARVKEVALLGDADKLLWHQDGDGLHIKLPARPIGAYAFVLRVKLQ